MRIQLTNKLRSTVKYRVLYDDMDCEKPKFFILIPKEFNEEFINLLDGKIELKPTYRLLEESINALEEMQECLEYLPKMEELRDISNNYFLYNIKDLEDYLEIPTFSTDD